MLSEPPGHICLKAMRQFAAEQYFSFQFSKRYLCMRCENRKIDI
jgi:hypothetical protein